MVSVKQVLIKILMCAGFASLAHSYDVQINTQGAYRIQIDDQLQQETYSSYNEAVESSISIATDCITCKVFVVTPLVEIEVGEVIPPIVPPPITPPTDKPTAYYSYSKDENGLVDMQRLSGAELQPTTVYIQWYGGDISSVHSWCCKTDTLDHDWRAITSNEGDTKYQLNLGMYSGSTQTHEMVSDVRQNTGEHLWSEVNPFTIQGSTPPATKDVYITWEIPTTRVDGTPLTIDDLSGYNVRYRLVGAGDWSYSFVAGGNATEMKIPENSIPVEANVQTVDKTPSTPCPDTSTWTEEQIAEIAYTCGGPQISDWSNAVKYMGE